jgi:ABC-2 type transport system ATP-binding protein
MSVLLKAEGIEKTYPNSDGPALRGIDFHVDEGDILGFLGPNGAGKTTAISIACTLLKPNAGSVIIEDVDALKKPGAVKSMIGMVPQDIALYANLTARENLSYFGKLYGLSGKVLKARIDECLEMMGLRDSRDKLIGSFSGGMKRRANLATGLLHRPKLLFLDEPTVGIDAQSRNMILDNLKELCKQGISMLYTSHYMEEVQQICNRVDIIDGGKIIGRGTPSSLVESHDDCKNLEDVFLKLTGNQLRD